MLSSIQPYDQLTKIKKYSEEENVELYKNA